MNKLIYLAGPMTGIPEYNYPAFCAAADNLRARGHTVMNPAENIAPPCGTWEGYMRKAIAQVVKADTIVLLPGWAESRGALVEYELARTLKIEVQHYDAQGNTGMTPVEPAGELVRGMGLVA